MIDPDTRLRPVRLVTSVLRMWSCQRILAIWRWHFIWNASKRLVSAAASVHVSQAYVRTGRTSVWYTRTLVGRDRHRSLQIGCRDDITDMNLAPEGGNFRFQLQVTYYRKKHWGQNGNFGGKLKLRGVNCSPAVIGGICPTVPRFYRYML